MKCRKSRWLTQRKMIRSLLIIFQVSKYISSSPSGPSHQSTISKVVCLLKKKEKHPTKFKKQTKKDISPTYMLLLLWEIFHLTPLLQLFHLTAYMLQCFLIVTKNKTKPKHYGILFTRLSFCLYIKYQSQPKQTREIYE